MISTRPTLKDFIHENNDDDTISLYLTKGPNSADAIFEICPVNREQQFKADEIIKFDSYFHIRHKNR